MQNYSLRAMPANTMETKSNILSTARSMAEVQRASFSGYETKMSLLCRPELQPIIYHMVRIDQIPDLKLEPNLPTPLSYNHGYNERDHYQRLNI